MSITDVRVQVPPRPPKKKDMRLHVFLFDMRDLNRLDAYVRWTYACRRLDGGNTLVFVHSRTKTQTRTHLTAKETIERSSLFLSDTHCRVIYYMRIIRYSCGVYPQTALKTRLKFLILPKPQASHTLVIVFWLSVSIEQAFSIRKRLTKLLKFSEKA